MLNVVLKKLNGVKLNITGESIPVLFQVKKNCKISSKDVKENCRQFTFKKMIPYIKPYSRDLQLQSPYNIRIRTVTGRSYSIPDAVVRAAFRSLSNI